MENQEAQKSPSDYFRTDASGKRYVKLQLKDKIRWIPWNDRTKMRPELVDVFIAELSDFSGDDVYPELSPRFSPEDFEAARDYCRQVVTISNYTKKELLNIACVFMDGYSKKRESVLQAHQEKIQKCINAGKREIR